MIYNLKKILQYFSINKLEMSLSAIIALFIVTYSLSNIQFRTVSNIKTSPLILKYQQGIQSKAHKAKGFIFKITSKFPDTIFISLISKENRTQSSSILEFKNIIDEVFVNNIRRKLVEGSQFWHLKMKNNTLLQELAKNNAFTTEFNELTTLKRSIQILSHGKKPLRTREALKLFIATLFLFSGAFFLVNLAKSICLKR